MIQKVLKNSLFKVVSINSISMVVSFILGLISTKFVAVVLGPAGMAIMGNFRNFTVMVKLAATAGINNALVKLQVENKNSKQELAIIYSTFFWLFLGLSIILSTVIITFSGFISSKLFFTEKYALIIILLGFTLPFIVLNVFWLALYNAFEKFKTIVLIQIIGNIAAFISVLYLINFYELYGAILSIAVAEILLSLVTFLFVRRNFDLFKFDLKRVLSRKYCQVILKFSSMALLSAIIAPLALILIRNFIISHYSLVQAGVWDGVLKLSNFYMIVFSSGLSLYYLPKLAGFTTDFEFKKELKFYLKYFVPFVALSLIIVFLFRNLIVKLAFTTAFSEINEVLIWQLAGDLVRIIALAFGYQIVVKTMMKEYFFLEIIYNLVYVTLAYYLVMQFSIVGALQAYFFANVVVLLISIFIFRKILFKSLV